MLGEQTKNMLIGAFIIFACALFVSFILFLRPTVGDEGQTLTLRFSDINNIGVGTRVLFAGRPVGEVVAIEEIPQGRKEPTDNIGRIYTYQLKVKIDSGIKIYNTDEVTIQTSGLLGEKSIGIIPKPPKKGEKQVLITDKPIYADSVDPLENALVQISGVATEMERTFKLAADWLEKNNQSMSDAVKHFGDAMGQVDVSLKQLQSKEAFVNAGDVIANLKTTTENLAAGKGTLGKLVNEDDLYVRISAMMSKLDIVLTDINHYGLLFHANKGWQRTRQQRAAHLHALSTPQGFRNYFEKEVQSINLAMSRLNILLERAEDQPNKQRFIDDARFQRDFTRFKSEVNALSENVKLFNQQLTKESNK